MSALQIGDTYERLTVVEAHPGEKRILCWCSCGTEHAILRSEWKRTRSCGCLKREGNTRRNSTHGMSKTPEYRVWAHVRGRCLNPTDQDYAEYGGRGIPVCSAWSSFEQFYADMGPRPEGTSLDRIDNEKGYAPNNCRWATAEEQANNRRDRRLSTHCGNGHEWTPDNTRFHNDGIGRTCRACHRENEAKRRMSQQVAS